MGNDFDGLMSLDLSGLTSEQLAQLIEKAKAKKEQLDLTRDALKKPPRSCPVCGGLLKRHGTTGAGTPRMICSECGKTISYGKPIILDGVELNTEQYKQLIMGMIDNISISKLADRLNVLKQKAHRLKILAYDCLYRDLQSALVRTDAIGNMEH